MFHAPTENPATPPGVPVPYPSFGFSSDTEQGTGTVKIGDKTVNIKNQSYLTKPVRNGSWKRGKERRHHLQEYWQGVFQFLVQQREI